MSQFRIKNIDQALPDEWIYKINDGLSSVGDDIDARDPNELADAIFDTQALLLKTSVLPTGGILKPNSGIAERITILEAIAGNSTLQDIYANGNTISLLSGKPLVFGTREEIKLDDAGNLSFKPVTMKVRGAGLSTLDISNLSVTSNLGDLLVGATSPGSKLSLRAENHIYFKDVFLTNPINLSEPGHASLATTSQSIVGAINELKSSSFSTTLQSVYDQSFPPKLTINVAQGSMVIENPNAASNADALRITGILNVTKKAKLGSVKIGNNTTIEDNLGYITSDPITTTNQVLTPYISSGINDLTLQDKRISFPLSDNSVSDLSTSKKSIIGAINELKSDIQTVGSSTTLFNNQHDSVTGFHKIITTQADIGSNAVKRITVKNQSGVDTFTITGSGDVVANSATIGGLSVINLLNDLVTHIANDGTAHTAVADHLIASNPHNTVKSLVGLTNNINLASTDSSINISTTGNTIDLKFNNNITMQQTYNNLVAKELSLPTASGLTFKDTTSSDILMTIRSTDVMIKKDLNLDYSLAKVRALADLTIQTQTELSLISLANNVIIKTTDASKKVVIQDVDFNEIAASTLPTSLGTSVLGAFKTLNDNNELTLSNHFNFNIDFTAPFILDRFERVWPLIADLHPANEFFSQVDFFWANQGPIYLPKTTVSANATGTFLKSGTQNLKGSSSASMPSSFLKGVKVYPMQLGHVDINIDSIASVANLNSLVIHVPTGKELVAITNGAAVDTGAGEFKVETLGSDPTDLKIDKTRNNLMATINDYAFTIKFGQVAYLKAAVWGEHAEAYVTISGALAADVVTPVFTITPSTALGESVTTSFYAKNTPVNWNDFLTSTDPSICAARLAEAINKTTFKLSAVSTNGHKCIATASGPVVKIKWYKPGKSGSLITLSSGNANLSAGLMTGGTAVVRVYNMEYSDTPISVLANTMPVTDIYFTSATISAKEKANQYLLAASEALDSTRYAPFYNKKEIGSIEGVAGNTIRLKIKD